MTHQEDYNPLKKWLIYWPRLVREDPVARIILVRSWAIFNHQSSNSPSCHKLSRLPASKYLFSSPLSSIIYSYRISGSVTSGG
jgi:hypothetical protein